MTLFDDPRLLVAIDAVRAASRVCREVRRQFDVTTLTKGDLSPVTVADFASQAVVAAALHDAFPADPLVAEEDAAELRGEASTTVLPLVVDAVTLARPGSTAESVLTAIDRGAGAPSASGFWTLDPIDGTKGYLRGGQYAVALAWLVDGRVELGVLGCPNLAIDPDSESSPIGTLFIAKRGQGAYSVALDGATPPRPVRVNPTVDPASTRFCEPVESGHSAQDVSANLASRLGISRPPIRLDSQAKYAVVARGEADLYVRFPTRADYREKIWDHAAGSLVIEEAGGVVSDIDGKPLRFDLGRELTENRGIVASSQALHPGVIRAIQAG